MAMNENTTGHLKELGDSDYEIVDGEPNIKGWDVMDTSGKQVGEVNELIFNTDTYKVVYVVVDLDDNELNLDKDKKVLVPISMTVLDDKDDKVTLSNVSAAQLGSLPAYEKGNITSQTESAIAGVFAGGAASVAPTTKQQDTTAIPIIEEKMQVGKREVETGGVRLKSRVVQENVEKNINLRSEHVHVEQTSVNRPATAADLETFKEGTIEMKEFAEVPVVSKEAIVTGEVSLAKEVEETNKTVEGTVRKTQVETEKFTDEVTNLADKSKLSGELGEGLSNT